MHCITFLLCLLAVAGCDIRSQHLPATDKWVRFHCPEKFSDKHVLMVEMPGKPRLAEQSLLQQIRIGDQQADIYSYACGTDGEYSVCAAEIPEQDRNPPLSADDLQEIGKQFAERMGATLTENKSFLFEQKYPALDLTGAQTRGISGNFRARIIYHPQFFIMLVATGRTKVVREPEVSYFFDSLLLYK